MSTLLLVGGVPVRIGAETLQNGPTAPAAVPAPPNPQIPALSSDYDLALVVWNLLGQHNRLTQPLRVALMGLMMGQHENLAFNAKEDMQRYAASFGLSIPGTNNGALAAPPNMPAVAPMSGNQPTGPTAATGGAAGNAPASHPPR